MFSAYLLEQRMQLYDGYREWKSWSSDAFGCCAPEQARYFSHEIRSAGFTNLDGARVLELGFGNGSFAAWAQSCGAQWTGVEAIPQLVEQAKQRGWAAYQARDLDLLSTEDAFHLVVAFDVFEHLELDDLGQLLTRLHNLLAPGGLLLGRVPSGDSPFSRAIQHGDITHRSTIGSSAIRQIACQYGFLALQTREPAFPARGQGIKSTIRRGLVKAVRAIVFPIIRLALMGNSQAVLTPNMVFVLKKPE